MAKTIQLSLNSGSIRNAIKELRRYKKELTEKCSEFVSRLADEGIHTAQSSAGEYGKYITFSKELDSSKTGATAIMYGTSGTIKRQWLTVGMEVREADISPLLMAEFGSGQVASDAASLANSTTAVALGMGQGSFPGQQHAFDPDGWNWMDMDGVWHSSIGEEPTMPMFQAAMEMENSLFKIAKEVFG